MLWHGCVITSHVKLLWQPYSVTRSWFAVILILQMEWSIWAFFEIKYYDPVFCYTRKYSKYSSAIGVRQLNSIYSWLMLCCRDHLEYCVVFFAHVHMKIDIWYRFLRPCTHYIKQSDTFDNFFIIVWARISVMQMHLARAMFYSLKVFHFCFQLFNSFSFN